MTNVCATHVIFYMKILDKHHLNEDVVDLKLHVEKEQEQIRHQLNLN